MTIEKLSSRFYRDRKAWDDCAEVYEERIVGGHPDILAFEAFEEDALDRILRFLGAREDRKIKLMDIGCGSGRLHVRYGSRTRRGTVAGSQYDPDLAAVLGEVWGLDFSERMIRLAAGKLASLDLPDSTSIPLRLEQGSAFDLPAESGEILPVAISLVNSIGVMQGREGAARLFAALRRAVEAAGGVAIISCYDRDYARSYALGQYESTMDVSGQPRWLGPDKWAGPGYVQVPRAYKLAHGADPTVTVDVFDRDGRAVAREHVLERIPERVQEFLDHGEIVTYSDYRSRWYARDEIAGLVEEHWSGARSWHLRTRDIDSLRAEPAQWAVLDPADRLQPLFEAWIPPR